MTTLLNTLTGASAGTDITNANSAGGGNAFDEIDTPQTTAGGYIRYGTSHGFPAIETSTGSTSGPQRVGWQVNAENATSAQYVAFYVDPADITGSGFTPFRAMNDDSTGQRAQIGVGSDGIVTLRNAVPATIWTSEPIASGTRYRIEVMWEGKGTAASFARVQIFVGEETVPVQDSGTLTDQNFGGPTQSVWFGQTSSASNNSGKIIRRVGWSDETWVGPIAGQVAETELDVHLGTGIPSEGSVTISQRWNNAESKSFRLVVSTSPLSAMPVNPVYGNAVTADSKGWVKMSISGLSSNTVYYGGVELDGVILLDKGLFTFKTAPLRGDARSQSLFFGSCRWNNGGDETFIKMKQMADAGSALHGSPIFLADMGDNGYPDWGLNGDPVTEDMVLNHLVAQGRWTNIEPTMRTIPWSYQLDNHDSGGEPSDKNGLWKSPVLSAYKRAVPHRMLPSTSGALYYSVDWGRVRYIFPDNRSERDSASDPDGPNKRMWSQEQEDWFIEQVENWPWVVCVLGGIYCRQDSAGNTRWGAYATQFNRIHDRLNAADSLRRLVWLAGDRHALAADLGVSPTTRGVPQAVGAPFEQGSVDLPSGEVWNVGGGVAYYNPTPNQNMRAFGEASFTDDGSDTITFNFVGRTSDGVTRVQMTKELDVSPRVIWKDSMPWMDPAANEPQDNIIWLENLKAGTNKAAWDIDGAFPGGHPTLQGFATAMSVNQGETLNLKVHSSSNAWTGTVYRMGYYGGSGAREIATITGPQFTQPNGTVDATTGMISMANWSVTSSWTVPADATPGVYFIKIARNDNVNFRSHIGPFVVRNPNRKAPMVVKLSDSTWQAYNYANYDVNDPFAGTSIYGKADSAGAFTYNQPWNDATVPRAKAASYDRPLVNRIALPQSTPWNGEYPFIKWIERLGYDVDYVSTIDVDADPTLLLGRKVAVSQGHDEYHSARVKTAFEDARDAGVHLVWLTANESFWHINPTSPGAREFACWKDSLPQQGGLNPTGEYSGTWQDTRNFNDSRRPASFLTGQRFRLNGIADFSIKANSAHANIPFWRNTSVASLTGDQEWVSPDYLLGFEGNEPADLAGTIEAPPRLIRLSHAEYNLVGVLSDEDGAEYGESGLYTHAMTMYLADSGAVVFAAGTNQYAWALDDDHVRFPVGQSQVSEEMRQALTNVLADMGMMPTSVPASISMPDPVAWEDYNFPAPVEPTTELFDFAIPPQLPDANDGQPITTGMRFAVRTYGRWVGNRVYIANGNTGTVSVGAYHADSQTLIASKTGVTVTPGQQVDIMFDTPVTVFPATNYTSALNANRYVASPSAVLSTGRIYTEANRNNVGKFKYSSGLAFPTEGSDNFHFHVSPIIEF